MKLNNKGFAISSVMYSLLILAIALMFGIIAILVSRKMTLDKLKKNAKNDINEEGINTPTEYTGVPSASYQRGQDIMYAGLKWVVLNDNGTNVTVVLDDAVSLSADSVNFGTYKTALISWLRQNTVLAEAADSNRLLAMSFSDNITSYSEYVRILSTGDIYGSNALPTSLGINNSIINNCSFCNVHKNYMLLNRKDASNAYSVIYNSSSEVNYLSTTTGILNVRPVITIVEY